jgi:putative colanic acid biosynthesis glycosyltransferase WcaI
MDRRLNILLISRYFPPEIGTAANLFHELASGLHSKGHKITVTTNFPWYNLEDIPQKYRGKFFMKENMEGFEVIRLAFPFIGPKKAKLAVGHLTAPITSFLGGCMVRKPDIIFGYSPPLFMGIAGWLLRVVKKVPFIMGVQDLHPQCYIDQGVLKNRFAIDALETLERFCYRKSSKITVHSQGNRDHIVNVKGAYKDRVMVIPNWIDTNQMEALPRVNKFSVEHNLNNKFVVGYAGTLGMSQGLMSVIESAGLLENRSDIEFFIVGDGIEKEKMIRRAKELKLTNVRFLGMQPKSIYPQVVASSDVQLVTLNSKVKTPVVPSKIISTMAAARPVLASMPMHGDAPKLIEEAKCGICIEPENPEMLAEKIVFLCENKNACENYSEQGSRYVTDHLSLDVAMAEIENMFREAISEN